MKKSKWLALAGVTLLATGFLAACSSSGSSSKSTYSYTYQTDPDNLNYLTTGKAATSDLTNNFIDGLLENDRYGNLVPSIAEDWTVSKDGLTYTYKLRKDAKWYTSEGEEYADVKAADFVAGLKYAADNKSDAIYLVQDSVKGLNAYLNGDDKDFSHVGVKALDDYTVQYTLEKPETFWNSKTTMGILAPVNEEFVKSKGNDFAKATDPTSILYNGPYLLKSITTKSSIEMAKNEGYWDKKNVHIDDVKLTFFNGEDLDTEPRGFAESGFSLALLNPNAPNYSKYSKKYKDEIFYGLQDSTTYLVGMNIDRQSYKYTNKKTDAEKQSTKKALLNKDFRQALTFAFDRKAYNAQANGEDGAEKLTRSLFVPENFVQANGKSFGDLVTAQLADKEEWQGVNLADGQDSLYNPTKAKAEFEKAKAALEAEGVQFPIHLDMPADQQAQAKIKRVQSFKQSIESTLGKENVVIDIHQMTHDDLNNITYFAETAAQEDWDISDNVGWSPDYQDPSTYLEVLNPSKGDSTKTYLGFDKGGSKEAVAAVGLDEYEKLITEAGNETADINTRYEKYAVAQAWLTDSALLIPTSSKYPRPAVQRTVPFTAPFAVSGNKGGVEYRNYKYLEVQKDPVTTKDYEAAKKKWEKERAESNEKAQKELADHVK